ncbi:hypothetical protein DFQ26_001971 [Actinomortierella ambigua]|nr:hypothetical protein DFQ26_001971 [Actinomortierella ambigua]
MAFSVRNIVFLALLAAMMLVTVQAQQSCYLQCQKARLPNCELECRDHNCYRLCMKQVGEAAYCSRSCRT